MDFVIAVVLVGIFLYILHGVIRSAVREGILMADEERESTKTPHSE
tara:strand:+ start:7246 stop:7383 length:138 start_codon:yes stop_codon:yes gene_type:complete